MFEAIDELEFPELYDETIPVLSFFRYLRKLMGAAGYHDLSMRVSCRREHNTALAYRACNTTVLQEWQGTRFGKPHSLRTCHAADSCHMSHTSSVDQSRLGLYLSFCHAAVSCRT